SQDPALVVEQDDASRDTHARLADALAGLDDRSRVILERRWLAESKSTLHELATEYGISAERIRQLEKNAMGKLQKVLVA
ncbi:MAG: sigma-70 family RNA polymerase sigma factor, partial [Gammaproteobacteria bacterium]